MTNKLFGGASHAKGIVIERVCIPVKPTHGYGSKQCVRVRLIKNGTEVLAYVPKDGCASLIEESVMTLISILRFIGHSRIN